tara:strand:+ start:296 stop:1567 length:1272 start_codon:yes stop_codon:yes gene_type:complete
MNNPILALIPSGYKEDKVYSVLPNDSTGDFDFVRVGAGTRVNKDGLIETIGASTNDIPRLDWLNSNCPSLLLEALRTNRQVYSEQFDNAAWTKQADLTVTANQIISPTGELNADKIKRGSTSGTNNYLSDAASKSSSAQLDICTSVFVKQGEGDFFAFRMQGTYPNRADAIFQFSNTTLTTSVAGADFTITSSKVENYGNGWYRLSVVYNTDAAATIGSYFSPRATTGQIDASDTSSSAFVYMWGCQVEEGKTLSSYIETPANSIVTRNADVCTDAGDVNLFNITEGTFFVDVNSFNPPYLDYNIISLSDGTTNNYITFTYELNSLRVKVYNGSNQLNLIITSEFNINQRNKVALKFKENEFKVYINGALRSTTTNVVVPTGFNRFNFASQTGADRFFEGKVYDARIYDTYLTDSELETLTTL